MAAVGEAKKGAETAMERGKGREEVSASGGLFVVELCRWRVGRVSCGVQITITCHRLFITLPYLTSFTKICCFLY